MRAIIISLIVGLVLAIGLFLIFREQPIPVGDTASAALASPDGEDMGVVTITQMDSGVLMAVELKGLAPGGHALAVHEVGACAPDFAAAGDHFTADYGLIHPIWQRGSGTLHEGDLPNVYAGSDGLARADFFSNSISLAAGTPYSVFDSDGSSIVVYEKPHDYTEEEEHGDRLACGVIARN